MEWSSKYHPWDETVYFSTWKAKKLFQMYIYICDHIYIYTSPMDSMGKVEMGIRSMIKKGSFDVWGNYRDFGWGHPPNGGLVSTIREPRNFRSQGSKDSMIWCDVFVHMTLPASSVSRTELLVLFEGIFVFASLAIRSVFFFNLL